MPGIIVVTGAEDGIGRATAEEFSRQSDDVGLLSRGRDRLARTATELRRHGVRALLVPTDVGDADEAAVPKIEAELGPIDVWIDVATATAFAPVSKLTEAGFERASAHRTYPHKFCTGAQA